MMITHGGNVTISQTLTPEPMVHGLTSRTALTAMMCSAAFLYSFSLATNLVVCDKLQALFS
jgi:hypothetical protein